MDTTDFDTREAAELAAAADEQTYTRYTQRITNLEYGIDGTLDMLDTLADRADDIDPDLATAVRNARQFLDGYRQP